MNAALGKMLIQPLVHPLVNAYDELRRYNMQKFRGDALAGLTVSVIAVPQAMAYALIAGVPAEYGLYTLIFQCLIGSIFNSQPLLSVGPTNTQALLTASIITRLVGQDLPEDQQGQLLIQFAVLAAFMKGAIQMTMAEARLGNLVKYVSHSVIVGFTAGAGVLIAAGQIKGFLGFSVERTPDNWPGIVGIGQRLLPHLNETSLWAIGLGTVALAIVLVSRRISRLAPGPLVAVAIAAIAVYTLGLTQMDLSLIRPLPEGLPKPTLPNLDLMIANFDAMLAGAFALALLGLLEAYSIGKNIANRTNTNISANQEVFSQGLTNFLCSFLSCFPGSASFSRSALNPYLGAKTFLSGVFNSLFVLIIFLLFAPAAKFIPMTAIAAILFVIAYNLIDIKYMKRVWRTSRADTYVCFGTFAATLFFPLAYAVFIGIFLNIALYLRRSSMLHMAEMVRTPGGPFVERPLRDKRSVNQQVVFLQLEGDLFFATADELQDALSRLAITPQLRVVILRMKRTHWVDTTVLSVLESFVQQMKQRDGYVLLCGVSEHLHDRLRDFGLNEQIGDDNIFETRYGVFASAKGALRRAKKLLGSSIDTDLLEDDQTGIEGWAYEI